MTDTEGNALSWASAGGLGFRGSREIYSVRSTDGCRNRCKGSDSARPEDCRRIRKGSWFRTKLQSVLFSACGIEVTSIKDVTPVPHNGCRPPKRRRV